MDPETETFLLALVTEATTIKETTAGAPRMKEVVAVVRAAISAQETCASPTSRRGPIYPQALHRGEAFGPRLTLIAACGSGSAVAAIAVQKIL